MVKIAKNTPGVRKRTLIRLGVNLEVGKMWLSRPPHAEQYSVKKTPLVIHQPNDIAVGWIRDPIKEKYFWLVPALPGLQMYRILYQRWMSQTVVRTSRLAHHVRRLVRHQPCERQNAKDDRLKKPKAAGQEVEAFCVGDYVDENRLESVNSFFGISNMALSASQSFNRPALSFYFMRYIFKPIDGASHKILFIAVTYHPQIKSKIEVFKAT